MKEPRAASRLREAQNQHARWTSLLRLIAQPVASRWRGQRCTRGSPSPLGRPGTPWGLWHLAGGCCGQRGSRWHPFTAGNSYHTEVMGGSAFKSVQMCQAGLLPSSGLTMALMAPPPYKVLHPLTVPSFLYASLLQRLSRYHLAMLLII